MNLKQLVSQYVAFRKSLGDRFVTNESILCTFCRCVGVRADINEVTTEQVSAFLAGAGPITSAWHNKYSVLRGFYRYAVSRGYVASAPLPTAVPTRPPGFVPHIYSHEELHRLLQATDSYQRHRSNLIEPITMRTLVLLLYGAGLRVCEAVALNRTDVSFLDTVLTVVQTKFFKPRLLPFGPQLGQVLSTYAARFAGTDGPFFVGRTGARLQKDTLRGSFRRLCERANVRRLDEARYQPRLHDLRHTFAVHRLASWYRQGADVQKLLPQLSVYLGHACLAATQVYLSMTPELLQEAGARFERYVWQENSHD